MNRMNQQDLIRYTIFAFIIVLILSVMIYQITAQNSKIDRLQLQLMDEMRPENIREIFYEARPESE